MANGRFRPGLVPSSNWTLTRPSHAPALIAPNPLNRYRYVVLNSGHTFGPDAFAGTNALLYPRVGDFAVFALDGKDTVAASGLFDEAWATRP